MRNTSMVFTCRGRKLKLIWSAEAASIECAFASDHRASRFVVATNWQSGRWQIEHF